ncbi:MAG TPA: UDP binding domain-containing protein, partial [Micromonosporaceae bacterium]
KADSDDTRESLSFKLRKVLAVKAREVLCTDPYVVRDGFLPLDEVLRQADLLVIGAPHRQYRGLATELPIADVWGITDTGTRV